jgi:O-antigen ligase
VVAAVTDSTLSADDSRADNIIAIRSMENAFNLQRRIISFGFRWPTLGVALIFDQTLLPMFHLGSIPFKLSYFILVFWFVMKLGSPAVHATSYKLQRDFMIFSVAWAVIFASGLMGEVWLEITESNIDRMEKYRISIFYLLTVFAFGLGLKCEKINLKWLVKIFYYNAIINFIFIAFPLKLPFWITGFYYSDLEVQQFSSSYDFINDVIGLLGLSRPLGIFGNPNISAQVVNLMALLICLALRCNLLVVSRIKGLGIIIIPVILSMLFASRGEFIVACVLAILNYRFIFKKDINNSQKFFLRKNIIVFIIIIISSIGLYLSLSKNEHVKSNFERISLLSDLFLTSDKVKDNLELYEGVIGTSRYLIFLKEGALDRFLLSPLVGTGFGHSLTYPFAQSTRYFHNDWARLLVTSGVLGLLAMCYLLYRFALPVGWPVFIPWILPGTVNSFMLIFPSFLIYWFILGVFRQKMYLQLQR